MDAAKVDTHHEDDQDIINKDAFSMGAFAETTPIWIFTPYFVPNLYQDYQWTSGPMMTNNVNFGEFRSSFKAFMLRHQKTASTTPNSDFTTLKILSLKLVITIYAICHQINLYCS